MGEKIKWLDLVKPTLDLSNQGEADFAKTIDTQKAELWALLNGTEEQLGNILVQSTEKNFELMQL
jgi:hypothetical protein